MSDPVIDLTTLCRLFKNDRNRIQEWITLYLAETPAYFQQIMEGAATNDAEQVLRALHDLRPMAHYLGAPHMLVLCDAIKELSSASDPQAFQESIAELLSHAQSIEVALNAELNNR
ncbi:MAG: Hpt domain-containing protein [Flavobacteriales bacterium]|jgi:HPt (histidine-containing phosphotransfer) domain-containing protein|nr:Hpt domain-containing protein [Flavobacteriales bacterium]MBK6944410.1 Hpt domain-containing protein [Flavobacteriales bacterium]MBK7242045.1 Hpt domain-containing protein [Flavobacteriales bacterium]MBK9534079.1 Hpt domain-containing protein [Flavobacteriales bacterium]MBP9137453.1 Hpt domain-containing protein [Flavobacteriales bacterium]